MINFIAVLNRQSKIRLLKWYCDGDDSFRKRAVTEVSSQVVGRSSRYGNVVEWRDKKLVYRRYASLYFIFCIDLDDNELLVFEGIHYYVETLDKYFGSVCELDLIYNMRAAHHILDETITARLVR
eukprot:gnl/Chilomastix_caulleri/228.p1 GENE.gnl/Chilomastix_caulleri/228~~gnl/Chilomastix_caulleri/228.p1  ORF type:complete len:125 (+),score=0.43 gnl/Chilomastix_caulleri/228:61-435(+)